MFVLIRALTYAAIFVGLVLVLLPASILSRAGVGRPDTIGPVQMAGLAAAIAGAALAIACVVTFALVGRGTPAPFDPPRRLVTRGPYGFVRNPMYLGAALALSGAALFLESGILACFVLVFLVSAHLFVVGYEEPALRRTFGIEYEAYSRRVRRWLPLSRRQGPGEERRT